MKKLIALVLALAFMLSFGGCANIENNKNDISQNPIDTTNPAPERITDYSIQDTDAPNSDQTKSVIVDDSLIIVQSVDALEKPYENFLWAEKWSEKGWVSGDGMSISHKLSDIDKEIPQITYGDDFEIHYGEGVEFISLSVYNSDFDRIHHNVQQEVLHTLEEGTYYLAITVKVQGEYIEADEKYEYSGYECAYKFVINN